MINITIEQSLKNRLLTMILLVAVALIGVYHYFQLPTDAFPDMSPVMVSIFTETHGMAPEEVERLVTFPIESSMNGLPSVTQVKSTSAFGMSVVYVYFEDDVDIYFARQLVAERVAATSDNLPDLEEPPVLGPISTGLGEVFMYYLITDSTVDTEGKELGAYLREINDWQVKYQLQGVKGVTEILSMGGHVLQYQIKVNPYALKKYDLTIEDIHGVVEANNRNAGGQFIVSGSEEALVRGIGLATTLEDLEDMPLKSVEGIPILMGDVAEVAYGNEIRRGVVTLDGEKDIVSGIVMKLLGENTSDVLQRLYEKLPTVEASLPQGVKMVAYYDQGSLVEKATGTIKTALWQGALLVLLTLLFFMGDIRAAIIVACALPVCALVAVIGMGIDGLSANLMSLGGIAIAIGMLADGSIVMVENIHRHLSDPNAAKRNKTSTILLAAKEVGRPIVFSLAIVVVVFLPIFTLEGIEKKMFVPMAKTISFAIIGSMLFAVVVAPVLASLLIKAEERKEFLLVRGLKKLYRPVLQLVLKLKVVVTLATLAAFVVALFTIKKLGTEFIPVLEEGTMVMGVVLAPSASLEQTTETVMALERIILANFDEVTSTISRIGRPEAGSHPHPVNYAMIEFRLKEKSEWKNFSHKDELATAIEKRLADFPGIQLNFTQPIQHSFDDLISGVKTQLAMKLYGEDMGVLKSKSEEIETAISGIEGLVDLAVEQSFGQPQLKIEIDRKVAGRYGVNVSDILSIVEFAVGGEVVDQIYLNNRRFGIHVRYQKEYRDDPEAIGKLLVNTSQGYQIPLSQVATITTEDGPLQINREKNQRRWTIQANVRGRDMGSVVADIQKNIAEKVTLPAGYYLEYGGQFQNQQRAMKRLTIIVPVAIGLIFVMLYLAFASFKTALLVVLSIPLSLIGGVFGLYFTGEYLSVPAAVGFIALFGIAVQDAMVMVTCIQQLIDEGMETEKAIVEGALLRLRPVLVTTVTTFLGLLPLLLSSGVGAEVQRPLAVVVIFGLISSTFLTLVVKPALFGWFEAGESH